MARFLIVDPGATEPFAEFIGKLDNAGPILREVGRRMVSASQRAFMDQRFGEFKWPPRYPNQTPPFLNVAGALSDWNRGATLKERRFQNRPALMDTGQLLASINSRVRGMTVEVGSMLERAAVHQWGDVTLQPITSQAKKSISKFLLTKRGAPHRSKLLKLLRPAQRTLDTEVVARPFLGIPKELEDDIVDLIEEELTK